MGAGSGRGRTRVKSAAQGAGIGCAGAAHVLRAPAAAGVETGNPPGVSVDAQRAADALVEAHRQHEAGDVAVFEEGRIDMRADRGLEAVEADVQRTGSGSLDFQ